MLPLKISCGFRDCKNLGRVVFLYGDYYCSDHIKLGYFDPIYKIVEQLEQTCDVLGCYHTDITNVRDGKYCTKHYHQSDIGLSNKPKYAGRGMVRICDAPNCKKQLGVIPIRGGYYCSKHKTFDCVPKSHYAIIGPLGYYIRYNRNKCNKTNKYNIRVCDCYGCSCSSGLIQYSRGLFCKIHNDYNVAITKDYVIYCMENYSRQINKFNRDTNNHVTLRVNNKLTGGTVVNIIKSAIQTENVKSPDVIDKRVIYSSIDSQTINNYNKLTIIHENVEPPNKIVKYNNMDDCNINLLKTVPDSEIFSLFDDIATHTLINIINNSLLNRLIHIDSYSCKVVGCNVTKNLIKSYNGTFCKEHHNILAIIRKNKRKNDLTTQDEILWRLNELLMRKDTDYRHIKRVEILTQKITRK
jgi:hypothetical protein